MPVSAAQLPTFASALRSENAHKDTFGASAVPLQSYLPDAQSEPHAPVTSVRSVTCRC